MTTDGGGWTRLNGSLGTGNVSFGASDTLTTNNIPQNCSPTPNIPSITVSGIILNHTQLKYILTRTTTVIQCPRVDQLSGPGGDFYQSGGSWVSSTGECTWSPPWSNGSDVLSGEPLVWKVVGVESSNTITFSSLCSTGSDDNGSFGIQFYVK